MSMIYSLAPYEWTPLGGEAGWRPPVGTVGAVDLRHLRAQGTPGPLPVGGAFFAGTIAPVDGRVLAIDTLLSEPVTTRMRDDWLAAVEYRPSGATLLDLLWDSLTTGADPTGQAAPKPLMPDSRGRLQLYLGGHSLVRSEKFHWGDSHTNRIQAVLQNDFAQHWDRDQDQARRVLDFWCEQFKVQDWQEFVPRALHAHVPGRLKHQTTFTESWPTNSTTISTGQDQPWNEDSNDAQVSSGHLTNVSTALTIFGRCTTNLSTDNHKHTATITISTTAAVPKFAFVSCRKVDSTVQTYYDCGYGRNSVSFSRSLNKCVSGTTTVLASDTTDQGAGATTVYVQANGSNISGAVGATTFGPVTDTAVTGNLQVGYRMRGPAADDTVQFDSHTAEDVAAGQPTIKRWQRVPGMRIGGPSFGAGGYC